MYAISPNLFLVCEGAPNSHNKVAGINTLSLEIQS